jgi:hypothetical protein
MIPALAAAILPAVSVADVAFDATRLREGRFTYQLSIKGKPLGNAVIEIRRLPSGDFRISFDSNDVDQRWSSQMTRAFVPLAAELQMPGKAVPYRMSIRYDGAEVSGTETRGRSAHPVSATLEGQVVDQRVDWAAMMAAEFSEGGKIEFLVFDPSTALSPLLGSTTSADPIASVLGTSDVIRLDYTIRKTDHTESYSVFATREIPRVMVREDMPNELTSVLIAIDE